MKEQFSFSRSFVHGELTMGFWNFTKKGIGLFGTYFILDALSLYQYGVYQLLLAGYAIFSEFFHVVFASSITNDIGRYIGEGKEEEAKRLYGEYVRFRLGMGFIPFAAAFFFAPFISDAYGPEAILWIRILSVLFVVDAAEALVLTLLKLRLNFRAVAMRPTVHKLVQAGMLASFALFYRLGITEIFIAQVAAPIVSLFFLIPPARRAWRMWSGVEAVREKLLIRIMRSFGKWEIPQAAIRDLLGRVRPWIIKFFLDTEAVGIFGVANTGISLLRNFIPRQTLGLLIPRKVHDKEYMQRLVRYGTKYYLALGVLLAAVGAVGYPVGIMLLFPKFAASIPLFLLLLFTLPVFTYTKLINVFLVAERRQKFVFYYSLFQNVLGIWALFIFLPLAGITGLAVAEVAALSLAAWVKYAYLVRTKFIRPVSFRELSTFDEEDRRIMRVLAGHVGRFVGLKR